MSETPSLILKRASASRPSGEWNEDDYDVLADGAVVGRIFKANAAPVGSPRPCVDCGGSGAGHTGRGDPLAGLERKAYSQRPTDK
jgi:hypothetical protein